MNRIKARAPLDPDGGVLMASQLRGHGEAASPRRAIMPMKCLNFVRRFGVYRSVSLLRKNRQVRGWNEKSLDLRNRSDASGEL